MEFVKVATNKDLTPGEMKSVKVGNKEILMINLANKYYAIGNACTHVGCMLSDGMLKDENVQCICHNSIFDVKTGKVIKGPAKKPEPTFQVNVQGENILIEV